MSDELFEKLKAQWGKIEESTKGYGPNGDQKAGDGEDGGIIKDTHSKPATPNPHGEGVQEAPKDTKEGNYGKDAKMDNEDPVKRGEGASEGRKEVGEDHGTDAAVDGAKPVPREEGAAAGAKEVSKKYEDFRSKLRGKLGLPLDSELNKGNDGLNK